MCMTSCWRNKYVICAIIHNLKNRQTTIVHILNWLPRLSQHAQSLSVKPRQSWVKNVTFRPLCTYTDRHTNRHTLYIIHRRILTLFFCWKSSSSSSAHTHSKYSMRLSVQDNCIQDEERAESSHQQMLTKDCKQWLYRTADEELYSENDQKPQGSHSFVQNNFQDFSRTLQYPKNIFPGLSHTPATYKYSDKQKLLTTYIYTSYDKCIHIQVYVDHCPWEIANKMCARAYFGICTYTIVSASRIIA